MSIIKKSFACLTVAVGLQAMAQEENKELDPVTITSSLNPITASRTGRNIVVIKGEQFSKLPVNSIDELLRYLPGLEVQARGPMGAQSDIVLRGGTFQQVLVVLDGMRLNDPLTGHFSSYIPLAPVEIERIEILKGASSAIYGSDAVGGVIHIITKTFAAQQDNIRQEATGQITFGEYNLTNVNAGGFYSDGKTAISAGILSNNAKGQQQRGTRGFFNLNTASLSFSHKINPNWNLSFRSTVDDRNFAAQNFYTTFASDTAKERVQSFWNQLRTTYSKGKNRFTLNVGYKAADDTYHFSPSATANQNRSKLLQSLAIYENRLNDRTTLIGGAQFQNRTITSNDRGNHAVQQAAGFVVLNQLIGSAFHISPAFRLDWDERGGTEWIPQLNLSYKIGAFQLRGSAGKTIRHADFTERFNNYNKTFVSRGSIGNPDLKAERSLSYEAGFDFFASRAVRFSASYFRRNQEDLIDWTPTPYKDMPRKVNLSETGTYALAKNIAEVNTGGFEADVQFIKQFSEKYNVFTTLGLVWLNSESSDAAPSFYVSSHAKFLTNFNLQFSAPRYAISFNGLYKSRKPQTGSAIFTQINSNYWVLNVKAEAAIIRNKLSGFVQLDNVLDEQYSDLLGSKMPGRWLMGGLKVSLSK